MILRALVEAHNQRAELVYRQLVGLDQERQQAYRQGFLDCHSLWVAWNLRRMEAEGRGETFTEPPPRGDK